MLKEPKKKYLSTAPAARIAILVGSRNDFGFFDGARKKCEEMGLAYELHALSAHRTPEQTRRFVLRAENRGIRIIIAAAGAAAHLAGFVAAHTTLPVIGVPLNTSPLFGPGFFAGHSADAGRYSRRHHGHRCSGSNQCRSIRGVHSGAG